MAREKTGNRAAGICRYRPGDRCQLCGRIEVAFRTIVVGARKLLVHQGFDKLEATRELQRRLTRRSDLRSLQRICVDKKTELLPLLQV